MPISIDSSMLGSANVKGWSSHHHKAPPAMQMVSAEAPSSAAIQRSHTNFNAMGSDDNSRMTTDLPTAHIDINALQGATRLDDWGVIKAEGEDAKGFLHSQLTQDTLSLATGYARLAGFCSAKGRLQASFVVWCTAPDVVYLACSADLLAPVLKRLSMFVLRAKCKQIGRAHV